jgi:hypothetical protein
MLENTNAGASCVKFDRPFGVAELSALFTSGYTESEEVGIDAFG